MLYLSGVVSAELKTLAETHPLGILVQPRSFYDRHIGNFRWWAADNGCFSTTVPFDERYWWRWLSALPRNGCLFAVCPDVVGDAGATFARSRHLLPAIREMGFNAAYAAQDGQEQFDPPWSAFDTLFIGGSTDWKLSEHAAHLAEQAKAKGKWVHMGRVNSRKRFRYAKGIGCDSVDGTFLLYGPKKNLAQLLQWLEDA